MGGMILSCVPLTSNDFLHTPSLASKALVIRIIFPVVRVTQVSFLWTGLLASLDRHKKSGHTTAFERINN